MRTSRRRTSRSRSPRRNGGAFDEPWHYGAWNISSERTGKGTWWHATHQRTGTQLGPFWSRGDAERAVSDLKRPTATRPGIRRNASKKASRAKFNELEVWNSVGAVRVAKPRAMREMLPPGLAAQFKKLAPGLYKYGVGPKRGPTIVQFKNASLKGALTSTRIGASKVGEYHWVIDNFDPSFPVIIRGIDDHGRTYFRVEEYAKSIVREPVMVKRSKTKRTSR